MKKLRAPTRKPLVLSPVWPNAGVGWWYYLQLLQLIHGVDSDLRTMLKSAWNETPPLFTQDAALQRFNAASTVEAHAAGVIFRTPEDRVLLLHRTDGRGWAFPGGMIEENETAEAAARREAFEETLHPCNGLLEFVDMKIPMHQEVRFATFTTEIVDEFIPTLNSEHDDFIWLQPVEVARSHATMRLHPGVWHSMLGIFDVMANDAPSSTKALQALLAKWGAQSIKRFDLMADKLATNFATRSMAATQISMTSQLKAAGFTVKFAPTRHSLEAYRAVAAENVGLIKSIPRKWHEQIEQKVWNAVRNGSDLNKLSAELASTYNSTTKRAALIARDQNAKAKAVIERVRQQELGIKRGSWMHSNAGKEPRPTHVAMNGKLYELAQGMWDSDEGEYVHPGQLINCRCSMRPVIDGAEEYADDDEQPTNVLLTAALRNAQQNKDKSRAAEMRLELDALRRARVQWSGSEEMQLRREIDEFLNETR